MSGSVNSLKQSLLDLLRPGGRRGVLWQGEVATTVQQLVLQMYKLEITQVLPVLKAVGPKVRAHGLLLCPIIRPHDDAPHEDALMPHAAVLLGVSCSCDYCM